MGTYHAPLGEPRVPKPSNQGGMKAAHVQMPMKARNTQTDAGMGTLHKGHARPGIGGSGSKNNPPRC